MRIQTVGVIGAGVIGAGVSQNLAQTDHRVTLVDVSEKTLERAKQEIEKNARLFRMFNKGQNAEAPGEIIKRINFTTDYGLLENAEFVIENVTEDWEVKKEVYLKLDAICSKSCPFAANTSAIPITRIASVTGRAPLVLGIHFMNPVPLKPLVEVIRGYHTDEQTIETARALLAGMGKECVVVNDSPGFVSNRVLMLMINEAVYLLQEGVSSVEDVDRIFKGCFGHKMGPLETADLIGLDTILNTIEVLYENFNDSKYRPCPLLRKMVDAGLCGRKSAKGFYTY